jgi:hypothetical protein
MDFSQKISEEEELANLFFELYQGLDRAYGSYKISNFKDESGKVKGRATTALGEYNVRLWVQHLAGTQGLGVVPIQDEGTCWWGAIDIDVYPLDLEQLEKDVRKLNLPLMVIRTKSGGAHLTTWFKEALPAKLVRTKLYEFALALGYGGVEIFPKQIMLASKADVGNWLNMPYFDLKNVTRYGIVNNEQLDVNTFLDIAYKMRLTEEQLRSVEVQLEGAFEDGPPCLQMICKAGVPEGTRNNTVFAMGVYAKMKFDDDWEAKVEEMNQEYVKPMLKSKEVQLIVKSLGRKEYFYPCNKAPLISSCNKDLCRKRQYGIGQGEQEFSLNMGSLVKITTEPPIWIMDVEGTRVQLDTEDLLMQERFRKACMMAINRLPPRIKMGEWEKIVREKLETVEIIEAPDESRRSSRINQYAYQFLANTPPARTLEEITLGRPFLEKETNLILFEGNYLIRYLENNGIKAEARAIWTSLRETGAEHGMVKTKKGNRQVWKVKAELLPDLNLDIPEDFNGDSF